MHADARATQKRGDCCQRPRPSLTTAWTVASHSAAYVMTATNVSFLLSFCGTRRACNLHRGRMPCSRRCTLLDSVGKSLQSEWSGPVSTSSSKLGAPRYVFAGRHHAAERNRSPFRLRLHQLFFCIRVGSAYRAPVPDENAGRRRERDTLCRE